MCPSCLGLDSKIQSEILVERSFGLIVNVSWEEILQDLGGCLTWLSVGSRQPPSM